jgi:hypothetical protein
MRPTTPAARALAAALRADDPRAIARLRRALQRHSGNVAAVCRELDLGYHVLWEIRRDVPAVGDLMAELAQGRDGWGKARLKKNPAQ